MEIEGAALHREPGRAVGGEGGGGNQFGIRLIEVAIDGEEVGDAGCILSKDGVAYIRECAQAVQGAAPPGAHGHGFGCEVLVEDRVAEVAGCELVHREFVEEHPFGHRQIFFFARGAVQGEIETQPVAFGASFGALLFGDHASGTPPVMRMSPELAMSSQAERTRRSSA